MSPPSPPALAVGSGSVANGQKASDRPTSSNRKAKPKKNAKGKAEHSKLDAVQEDEAAAVNCGDEPTQASLAAENASLRAEVEDLRLQLQALRALAMSSGDLPSSFQKLLWKSGAGLVP